VPARVRTVSRANEDLAVRWTRGLDHRGDQEQRPGVLVDPL